MRTYPVTVQPNGCWYTHHKPRPNGYVQATVDGKMLYVHRVFFELYVGPIPAGAQIDHLCRDRRCCNPSHLEPVSPRENTLRSPVALAAANAAKTHCARGGHPLVAPNLMTSRSGRRVCRECELERKRERRRRRVRPPLD